MGVRVQVLGHAKYSYVQKCAFPKMCIVKGDVDLCMLCVCVCVCWVFSACALNSRSPFQLCPFSHCKRPWIVIVFRFSAWWRKVMPGCSKTERNLSLPLCKLLGFSWLPHIKGLSKSHTDLGAFCLWQRSWSCWCSWFLSSIFNLCSCLNCRLH